MNENLDDETPLDPAEMLALVKRSQLDTARRAATLIPWILITWGVAWLIGFGLLWLAYGPGVIGETVAWVVFAVLMILGVVASAILGTRATRGTRDTKAENMAGLLFGLACMAGFISVGVLGYALAKAGMSFEVGALYYPSMYGLIIGVTYLFGGATWRTPYPAYVGGWLIVVSLVAPFVPFPLHYLVFSIAGGGAFLVAGIIFAAWSWKRAK
ncbi:hypothetical protein [Microbacterium gorillae]|uniref:hypothetical protein n=1 Tax=Microbacterium gorillae TaxID=1231063 RepID=UPI00058AD282|nr:hypothetical protein [Microbacterium gorillae]